MFSRLLQKIFGNRLLSKEEYKKYLKALGDNADLGVRNQVLELKLKGVTEQLQVALDELKTKKFSVIVGLKDPSPVDKLQRALYVAQVAGLHKEILEPKFKQMISGLHEMLEEATNDREYDQSLKGAIYFAWEVIRWGQAMVNEQLANQTDQNNSSETDKDINKK